MRKLITLALFLLTLPAVACDSNEYRQFDFWLGEWEVFTQNGQLAGNNKITQDYNSCVIVESYSTPAGYRGTSLNMYDRQTQMWHQTWVDNSGVMLRLAGGLVGEAMVLKGDGKDPTGKPVKHKISWSSQEDGSVRQHWQASQDEEKTWGYSV